MEKIRNKNGLEWNVSYYGNNVLISKNDLNSGKSVK